MAMDQTGVGARLQVLVVDDAPEDRMLLREQLSAHDVTVLEAASGRSALDLLATCHVDLVIADLAMPGMDGVELARQLAAVQPGIGFAVTTGRHPSVIRPVLMMAEAYGLRVAGALAKPVSAEELRRVVAAASTPAQPEAASAPMLPATTSTMRDALALRFLGPHLQPQVDLTDGRVVGAEALLRWTGPGAAPWGVPDMLGRLRDAGLLDVLTTHMLRESAAWLARQEDRPTLSVSVNIEPSMLTDTSMVDRWCDAVEQQGVATERIVLEITEHSALRQPGPSLEVMSRLRMRGFGLALDDFGTGYTSMLSLERLPLTEVKLDQALVGDLGASSRRQMVLASVLDLGERLGLQVVAEGVEDVGTRDLLLEAGASVAQGWLWSAAVPPDELPRSVPQP